MEPGRSVFSTSPRTWNMMGSVPCTRRRWTVRPSLCVKWALEGDRDGYCCTAQAQGQQPHKKSGSRRVDHVCDTRVSQTSRRLEGRSPAGTRPGGALQSFFFGSAASREGHSPCAAASPAPGCSTCAPPCTAARWGPGRRGRCSGRTALRCCPACCHCCPAWHLPHCPRGRWRGSNGGPAQCHVTHGSSGAARTHRLNARPVRHQHQWRRAEDTYAPLLSSHGDATVGCGQVR
jgi:hypothetical protein